MDDLEIRVEETRGAKPKYDFSKFELGEIRTFPNGKITSIHPCAKAYAVSRGLTWKFRSYTKNNIVHLVRVK